MYRESTRAKEQESYVSAFPFKFFQFEPFFVWFSPLCVGKCHVFFSETFDFSTVDRIRGERKINDIISSVCFGGAESHIWAKKVVPPLVFSWLFWGLASRHRSSHIHCFSITRRALYATQKTHIYIITKNDDDDADDARDDDAVFVFVFWKKQQKEPFDDHHDGEER